MMDVHRTMHVPGAAHLFLRKLAEHANTLNSGLISKQLRQYSFTNVIDKVSWKSVTATAMRGVMGGGEGPTTRGGVLDVRIVNADQISLSFGAPDWVKPIFVIFMLICLLPPLWPAFGLGLLTYFGGKHMAFPNILKRYEADIRRIAAA